MFANGGFRRRLIRLVGGNPGSTFHAHHVIPKQFRGEVAEKFGIDVNDPTNGIFIPSDVHRAIHRGAGGGAYNDAVLEVITNSNNRFELEAGMSAVMRDFGIMP